PNSASPGSAWRRRLAALTSEGDCSSSLARAPIRFHMPSLTVSSATARILSGDPEAEHDGLRASPSQRETVLRNHSAQTTATIAAMIQTPLPTTPAIARISPTTATSAAVPPTSVSVNARCSRLRREEGLRPGRGERLPILVSAPRGGESPDPTRVWRVRPWPGRVGATMRTVNGKTVLVTGATDGLGRGLTCELAAAGATVLIHGRDPDRIRATRDQVGSGRTYQADFASLAEVGRMADR